MKFRLEVYKRVPTGESSIFQSEGKKHQTKLISRIVFIKDLLSFCFTAMAKDLNLKLGYFTDLGVAESWLCTVLSNESAENFTES